MRLTLPYVLLFSIFQSLLTDQSLKDIRHPRILHVSLLPFLSLSLPSHPIPVHKIKSTRRWISDVSTYPSLDTQSQTQSNNVTSTGPVYELEYSARELYGPSVKGWGAADPLNATWWHRVTEGSSVLLSCFIFLLDSRKLIGCDDSDGKEPRARRRTYHSYPPLQLLFFLSISFLFRFFFGC